MRHIVPLLLLIIIFSGCRDKVICPAFQSTYILDDSVRVTYYSYLWKLDKEERTKYLANKRSTSMDSVATMGVGNGTDYFAYVEEFAVPPNEVKKSKFGMVRYEPYWLTNYKLKSAPMENILSPPVEKEVEETPVDVGEFVAADFSDTINVAGDTTSVAREAESETDSTFFELPTIAKASKPKPKKETVYLFRYDPEDRMLNVEQQYYNKHFGQQLYKKVEVAPASPDENVSADSLSEESSGGLKGFFSFGKKKKDLPGDQTSEDEIQEPALNEAPPVEGQEEISETGDK